MVVQAGAERLAGDVSPRTEDVLTAIESTGRQALVELRTMLGVLRDGGDSGRLEPQPDLRALTALVESVRAAGLDVVLDMPDAPEVPQGVGLAAYRVVQESLTNALRHGDGRAQVRVTVDDEVHVEVRNPVGSSPLGEGGAGRGLVGMRERVALFAGHVEARRCGDEWVVCAELPRDRGMRP
jgi:signal transduction histidine kinase